MRHTFPGTEAEAWAGDRHAGRTENPALSDTAGYCVFLEKTFPEENYKVLPQERVRIYAPKRPGEAYSQLAAEHDIAIKSMQILQSSLEDYYMKLKERGAGK